MTGLWSIPALLSFVAWCVSSFLTLFMNKYTLSTLGVEAFFFSIIQIAVSVVLGLVNMYFPCYMGKRTKDWGRRPRRFYISMGFVGLSRFLVVFLSLLSLEYVAVSFTETVKSSAPLFTVFISWVVLGERNGLPVLLSLIPIMMGLMMCTRYEASYNMVGFMAAMGTNLAECLQFVLSKKALSADVLKTTPAEFQFFSCLASTVVQLPICLLFMDYSTAFSNTTAMSFAWMLLNGIMYHLQTMTAWVLMEYVSSVTHSVCNTVKRAIAIWLSIYFYGNPVTLLGGLGTLVVILGVLLYNKAREYEMRLVDRNRMGDKKSSSKSLLLLQSPPSSLQSPFHGGGGGGGGGKRRVNGKDDDGGGGGGGSHYHSYHHSHFDDGGDDDDDDGDDDDGGDDGGGNDVSYLSNELQLKHLKDKDIDDFV